MTDLFKEDERQDRQRIVDEMNDKIALMRDWKATFSSDHGRRVLLDILDPAFIYDSIFTGNSRTYYNAAFQDFGKKILDMLAIADPETFQWFHLQRANFLNDQLRAEWGHAEKVEKSIKGD